MKCNDCLYDSNCSLKEIANDITGCDGHSKYRDLKEDEVICSCCKKIVKQSQAFSDVCFKCY